jgi:hypothetical protein
MSVGFSKCAQDSRVRFQARRRAHALCYDFKRHQWHIQFVNDVCEADQIPQTLHFSALIKANLHGQQSRHRRVVARVVL